MKSIDTVRPASCTIEPVEIDTLLTILKEKGYEVIGPSLSYGAIDYQAITSSADLPKGWKENQDAATYRLVKRHDNAYFGFNTTPQGWKKFLHPPVFKLLESEKKAQHIKNAPSSGQSARYAFFGIRSCDLAAINILDKIFLHGSYVDTNYRKLRNSLFTIAVNCTQAGGTCFCASMNTGPRISGNCDIALTEIYQDDRHYFLAEIGSKAGYEVINVVPHNSATDSDLAAAERAIKNAADNMGRILDTSDIKSLLYRNLESRHWSETAKLCLSCANCTMVCPTCFCATIEDVTDLTGKHAERVRKWDSCFTMDFSYIHGGSVRSSVQSRYRQWLAHKFAYWHDQFGTSGCVGCGRCITWCPVGIDVTKELQTIRKMDQNIQTTISSKENC